MTTWGDYFTSRQLLALTTFVRLTKAYKDSNVSEKSKSDISAIQTCLALAIDRCANQFTSLSKWNSGREMVDGVFARQAIPMLWDFGEISPFSGDGYWNGAINWIGQVIEKNVLEGCGCSKVASAINHPLKTDSAQGFITDPPYYYSVQYADLSDFFYVWLHRSLGNVHPDLFHENLTPKTDEIIVQSPGHEFAADGKNRQFYESRMQLAMAEGRRILCPDGIGVIVFANTSTAGWETLLQSLVESGWVITGSWPIDTEMASRVLAQNRSVLASSIHLVCRPRDNPNGSFRSNDVGDWRDVLHELPIRIHEWMPRLAAEGVVGADAIFACLGPALEIYSRYSRVEKPNGEQVLLREYLEKVWEAVAREALTVIFHDADTSGFEEDARLTAMWLWTLSAGGDQNGAVTVSGIDDDDIGDDEKSAGKKTGAKGGFTLEYDAARKIAQGLGAHPDEMRTLVEVKGDTARLLSVSERAQYLFGKQGAAQVPVIARRRGKQMTLGESTGEGAEDAVVSAKATMEGDFDLTLGKTMLDSVHQGMLLFGAGRSDALKTFLVDNGAGKDPRFWRLAQALSALYPKSSEEKRWVDGVLARKKGLGL